MQNKENKFDIIVTGATGFVGRSLVKELIKLYPREKILCLIYNKNSGLELSGRRVLKKLRLATKLVDLTSEKTLSDLPKNPKLVIHLAAATDTATANHSVNDIGLINFYKSIGPLNPKTLFIHISTSVLVSGRKNCDKPIDEKTPVAPTNEYTRTKLAGENFITQKSKKDKFRLVVLRPNTIYGKNVRDDSLFDMLKKMIIKNSPVTRINWPGKSAIIHVSDVVKAIVIFLKRSIPPGKPETYLLYTENFSIYELSKIMHKNLNLTLYPIAIPTIVWKILKYLRRFIPFLEKILPSYYYNWFWRLGLIVDDVINCGSKKAFGVLRNWKPVKFEDEGVRDLI